MGDFNRDGLSDIALGFPESYGEVGKIYIIYGNKNLTNIDLRYLDNKGIAIYGFEEGDNFGQSISSALDFNGDGIDDLIVGAPGTENNSGKVYIIYGGNYSTDINLLTLNNYGISIHGDRSFRLGSVVSSVGDFNRDGFNDVIIGSSQGKSYVVYGGKNLTNIKLQYLGDTGFAVKTDSSSINSIDYAGDVNGDGIGDIILGDSSLNGYNGVAYIIYGFMTGPTSAPTNQPSSQPTAQPSSNPTAHPTPQPSHYPYEVTDPDLGDILGATGTILAGTAAYFAALAAAAAAADAAAAARASSAALSAGEALYVAESAASNANLYATNANEAADAIVLASTSDKSFFNLESVQNNRILTDDNTAKAIAVAAESDGFAGLADDALALAVTASSAVDVATAACDASALATNLAADALNLPAAVESLQLAIRESDIAVSEERIVVAESEAAEIASTNACRSEAPLADYVVSEIDTKVEKINEYSVLANEHYSSINSMPQKIEELGLLSNKQISGIFSGVGTFITAATALGFAVDQTINVEFDPTITADTIESFDDLQEYQNNITYDDIILNSFLVLYSAYIIQSKYFSGAKIISATSKSSISYAKLSEAIALINGYNIEADPLAASSSAAALSASELFAANNCPGMNLAIADTVISLKSAQSLFINTVAAYAQVLASETCIYSANIDLAFNYIGSSYGVKGLKKLGIDAASFLETYRNAESYAKIAEYNCDLASSASETLSDLSSFGGAIDFSLVSLSLSTAENSAKIAKAQNELAELATKTAICTMSTLQLTSAANLAKSYYNSPSQLIPQLTAQLILVTLNVAYSCNFLNSMNDIIDNSQTFDRYFNFIKVIFDGLNLNDNSQTLTNIQAEEIYINCENILEGIYSPLIPLALGAISLKSNVASQAAGAISSIIVLWSDFNLRNAYLATKSPTLNPTTQPSSQPTANPSDHPSSQPSSLPTIQPSVNPTSQPSGQPSESPSAQPSVIPSINPTTQPSSQPTANPSDHPSSQPSPLPTIQPSFNPTSQPSGQPSDNPSAQPSVLSILPSIDPTSMPTKVTLISSGGAYNGTSSNENFIIKATSNLLIYGGGGSDTFKIEPVENIIITVADFNIDTNKINLQSYPIYSFNEVNISAGSIIITLYNNQIIRLLELSPGDIDEQNFIFAALPVPPSEFPTAFFSDPSESPTLSLENSPGRGCLRESTKVFRTGR